MLKAQSTTKDYSTTEGDFHTRYIVERTNKAGGGEADRQKDWPTNGDKREKTGIECRGGRREREREIGWYA